MILRIARRLHDNSSHAEFGGIEPKEKRERRIDRVFTGGPQSKILRSLNIASQSLDEIIE